MYFYIYLDYNQQCIAMQIIRFTMLCCCCLYCCWYIIKSSKQWNSGAVRLSGELQRCVNSGGALHCWYRPSTSQTGHYHLLVFVSKCIMYLCQIDKCICLKLQNVFVSNALLIITFYTGDHCAHSTGGIGRVFYCAQVKLLLENCCSK